jgi:hypothetical protein
MLDERMHNYPEGYEEKPWCPNTKLVQICASLAGVELTPETFCTEELANARYSDGAFQWLEHGDFYPRASCAKVNRELIQQLKIVKEIVELPSDKEITLKIEDARDLPNKLKILRSYDEVKGAYDQRKAIINRWRNVVFETCCSTVEDENNKHFRQFKSVDELDEKEVIQKVNQFTSALIEITEYND